MISTLAWKEYREHHVVWAAMAGLAIFLMIILTQAFAPNGVAGAPQPKLQMIALAALILAETYGLICGAMMVAGEQEARTQTFLDTLPTGRTRLWITKVLMGTLFTLAQALVVTGVLVALGLTEVPLLPAGWQLALPLVALEAFGHGLFGSVLGRSVLGAIGWALLPVTVSWLIGGEVYWPPSVVVVAVRTTLLLLLLGLAGLIFCRPDFQRGLGGSVRLPARTTRPGQQGWGPDPDLSPPQRVRRAAGSTASESWRVLLWLTLRQGWSRIVLFALAGWVIGHLLTNTALATWPLATLLVGVAFGTGMFSGEQAGGSYRFLGDQRLPPGRVWLAKATTWFGLAGVVLAAIFLGAFHPSIPFRSGTGGTHSGRDLLAASLLLETVPKDVFLLLWPVYGFSVGQLLGLLCRKNAVALVLSVLVSVPVAGIWIPSLITGGLKLWQVLPVAVPLLLSTRLGLWAWAGGMLTHARSVLGLLGCMALASVWLTGNLVYRAIEIPELGRPFDEPAFLAEVRAHDPNTAGSLIHTAAQKLTERERLLDAKRSRFEPPTEDGPPLLPTDPTPIAQVLENGWPQDDAKLVWWLDQICQDEWIEPLREAAALPVGAVENLQLLTGSTRIEANPVYLRVAQLLVARALERQAQGDPTSALDHVLWALALSRHLRYQTVRAFYEQGQTVEVMALQGLDRWLERLGPERDLLRRALEELTRHEDLTPPATDPVKAEYLLLRERLIDPARWLVASAGYGATAALESDLVLLSLHTPWESERAVRFLDALTSSRLKEAQTPYWQLPLQARSWDRRSPRIAEASLASLYVPGGRNTPFTASQWERLLHDSPLLLQLFTVSFRPQHELEAFAQCRVRAARVKMALALYQVEAGKPAPILAHLVPRYLEELPLDPFSGQPFQYRVSAGERIEWRWGEGPGWRGDNNRPEWTDIPAGQGILWSVGPESSGAFGTRGLPFHNLVAQEHSLGARDQVFLVPLWPQ